LRTLSEKVHVRGRFIENRRREVRQKHEPTPVEHSVERRQP
jgi:hypothetical protein